MTEGSKAECPYCPGHRDEFSLHGPLLGFKTWYRAQCDVAPSREKVQICCSYQALLQRGVLPRLGGRREGYESTQIPILLRGQQRLDATKGRAGHDHFLGINPGLREQPCNRAHDIEIGAFVQGNDLAIPHNLIGRPGNDLFLQINNVLARRPVMTVALEGKEQIAKTCTLADIATKPISDPWVMPGVNDSRLETATLGATV